MAYNDALANGTLSLLQDAEGNHCSSFPATLLQLIQRGAQLLPSDRGYACTEAMTHEALLLLRTAQSFNPLAWATNLQTRSPASDLHDRTHVASAHRAAVCIYLSRVILSLDPSITVPQSLQGLTAEVVSHLSFILPGNALFIAITWPAFIAGAETQDHSIQTWVALRFQELWEVEPWGLLRGASGVLQNIWAGKKNLGTGSDSSTLLTNEEEGSNWIRDLRREGIDWLII